MLKKDLLMIYKMVENKFEDTGQQILGSLLFLRFICPAIVSPVRYNLVTGNHYQLVLNIGKNIL